MYKAYFLYAPEGILKPGTRKSRRKVDKASHIDIHCTRFIFIEAVHSICSLITFQRGGHMTKNLTLNFRRLWLSLKGANQTQVCWKMWRIYQSAQLAVIHYRKVSFKWLNSKSMPFEKVNMPNHMS